MLLWCGENAITEKVGMRSYYLQWLLYKAEASHLLDSSRLHKPHSRLFLHAAISKKHVRPFHADNRSLRKKSFIHS